MRPACFRGDFGIPTHARELRRFDVQTNVARLRARFAEAAGR